MYIRKKEKKITTAGLNNGAILVYLNNKMSNVVQVSFGFLVCVP